jgi:hypothetical protein
MKKWTLLAPVTLVAFLAGGYALFARRPTVQSVPGDLRAAESDLDVEDFEVEESAADGERPDGGFGDGNSFNMTDEGDGEVPNRSPAQTPSRMPAKSVEVIEDEDDPGETVPTPLVVDDSDEAGVEMTPADPARQPPLKTTPALGPRP